MDYLLDYENPEHASRIETVLKRLGVQKDFVPRVVSRRYTGAIVLFGTLAALMAFILPHLVDTATRCLLVLTVASCVLSFGYTFRMSGGLSQRSPDDLLTCLRDGVDPALLCPSCNIVQSRAVHCDACNMCVADPYCQHSHMLATCITSRNRRGYIWFVMSLLATDLFLLMLSITNFRIEIIPGLQFGIDGPFNFVVSLIFVLTIGAVMPLLSILT